MKHVPLIKVRQWLDTWNKAQWAEESGLGKPKDHFFVGAMALKELRSLAGVTQRTVEQRKDPTVTSGYQRAHESARSKKISRYVDYGYPLSTSNNLDPAEHQELINPGWLPNAIIVNVIPPGTNRNRNGVDTPVPVELEVSIDGDDRNGFKLIYPPSDIVSNYQEENGTYSEPIEIIDGQHRLFALDYGSDFSDDFQVPVVFFYDLSLSWQAYLFWTINVEPKKINPSLAYDLYPELRRQEWLEKSEAIKIYRDHRSQEMAEILWSHKGSPWKSRIELHGRRVRGHVSNAAFIRSLTYSFIKKWVAGERIGGLFGSIGNVENNGSRVLPWKRAQQAAFLIQVWTSVHSAVSQSSAPWVKSLEQHAQTALFDSLHPAFSGEHSLLATDQGVRAIHNIFNAIFQHDPEAFGLQQWHVSDSLEESPSEASVSAALKSLKQESRITGALKLMSESLVNQFDWRLSSAPGLTQDQKKTQGAYRGSSGYTLMMTDLVGVLSNSTGQNSVKKIANEIGNLLIKK